MLFIDKLLLNHITICNGISNMIQQALRPVNKRGLPLHISMMQHKESALKRHVGGIYGPHQACLIILINFLKGDDQAGITIKQQSNNSK